MVMESKQLKHNTITSILTLINQYYKKIGINKVKAIDYDLDYCFDTLKFKTVVAMENTLKTDLECDLKITDDFLEKIKIYINGL